MNGKSNGTRMLFTFTMEMAAILRGKRRCITIPCVFLNGGVWSDKVRIFC